jgi:hypothetical protein
MTSGTCSRCGAAGIVEYGSDGQAYCSSCVFYGLNKQCWRCRMYLPATELQQYKGQWACPYCIMDMRESDRRSEEHAEARPKLEAVALPERCERCGRDLENRVYIWNGRKLCKTCVNEEQEKWGIVGGGPMSAPYKVTLEPEKKRKKVSLLEHAISEALFMLRLKRRPRNVEVIVINEKMPISRAKPMAEAAIRPKEGKGEQKPEAEGLMREKPVRPFELERRDEGGKIAKAVPMKAKGKARKAGKKADEKKKQ